MVDIHSHILPYLDDGAQNMEEAITMAEMAAGSGINHMVTSCHGNYFPYTLEEYWEQFEKFQTILKQRQIPLKLHSGMEIFVDRDVTPLLERKELLTLNGTNYVLVEVPFEDSIGNVQKNIEKVSKKGYNTVLAHPERYHFIQKDPEFAYYLEETGCILQLNQGSLTGDFGAGVRNLALQLLRDGVVSVIATDAHDARYRTPSTRRLLEFLRKNYSEAQVHLWLSENPSRILKGYPVIRAYTDGEEKEYDEES